MESKETNNGDDIPTSTFPPLRNEDVRSNSSPNEQGNFNWIFDEVTVGGAVNVNNLARILQIIRIITSIGQKFADLRRVMRSIATGQQFPANQNIGVQNHMFPQRILLQLAGHQVPANQNFGVQGYIFPQGIPFQLAGKAFTPFLKLYPIKLESTLQVAEGGLLPKTCRLSPFTGQVTSVVRGRRTAQVSNYPTGPSQWRYPALVSPVFCPSFTANPYLVALPVQHTTKPQTDSSISESIQAAPSPTPPVQTAPFPPKTQIFCPISQTAAAHAAHPISPLANKFIPCHVVQGNFGQSQTTASIQPARRLTSPAYTFGPVIPVGRLAQASNAPVQPSSNRSTNQACQYRPSSNRSAYKTRPVQPSSNRSAYKTPPIRLALIIRRREGELSQTDLSDLHALAQGTKNFPINRIKQGIFFQVGWGMGSGADHDFNLGQKIRLNLIPQCASNVCNVKDDMNARHYNSNDCNYTSRYRFRRTSSAKWTRVFLLQEGSFIHTRSRWPHFPAKYSSICCSFAMRPLLPQSLPNDCHSSREVYRSSLLFDENAS
ncbi:hypothetical protein Patl1_34821 [Pistacia atlantica]|uniref:Uncharacterized protein n=1 Tax=Pistacia atlantica TaxID=434234 RepID=A0ACC0ZTM3_9ROSI|nr:hypothetical protein Patl1_34821 [Pistacia atlantica]